ncbi:MAG TPA: pyruvate, phosphate dikinase [candidate division WOR-3 bacterium]|uniref:Pyruvate, phosphate dikinase n=1 Tax=candidate division WOR-3 bacterium TaxID=2052148 RepID=A0A9C9ENU0_UNCW3|nr:pyruvate, phosphate dikinase [candidate division WOR-3 bacterium]
MAKRLVYNFGGKKAQGSAKMKNILGGKGANLAEMTNLGVPVPPGFTISSELCIEYLKRKKYPQFLRQDVEKGIKRVEKLTGKIFGDKKNPLLFSVRSGARTSMPGMMDTILNLGLNDSTINGLIENTGDKRFAYDCYRRFIQMYSDIVLQIPREKFEALIDALKKSKGYKSDLDLSGDDWYEIVKKFKKLVLKETKKAFPGDPREQLWGAIGAVFNSWNNPRAKEYRRIYKIPDDWGTAVNVQSMVFGNMGENSATGVVFTRNPATGENKIYGEFLQNAQGEDVVAGIRTPRKISELKKLIPSAYNKLVNILNKLEKHYRDLQDVEFTVEKGKLWILQTRAGKRTALANIKIAVDMALQKLIKREEAVMRVTPAELDQVLHPMIDPTTKYKTLTKGLPASPGAAVGQVVFDSEEAVELAKDGKDVILVRLETSADDIHGMEAAKGFLTARGGMTSHAAVVARGMGKPCIVGCGEIKINTKTKTFSVGDTVVKWGDIISIDGTEGRVILGKAKLIEPEMTKEVTRLLKWADSFRRLGVRTNADRPKDSKIARDYGAEGIGLCRTEHMFFKPERVAAMREMIVARDEAGRRKALAKLLPMQREDFIGIFKVMDGLPVIIRTLDPPLHEFLPKDDEAIKELARDMKVSFNELKQIVISLHEANPMLGHRGCRLGITYPEITEMQARAIFEAACEVTKQGIKAIPEVMIPVVMEAKELAHQRAIVEKIAKETIKKYKVRLKYMIGTMIEIPRAALTADEVAKVADFFSYGTNDMTQTTLGFSRDDVAKFVPQYIEMGLLKDDPFKTIDINGVGKILEIGIKLGRKTNPRLEIGICGEHGGDPKSIYFCHKVGMDYVSCSPYRVPIARLAAAHAALEEKYKKKK